MKIEWLPIIWSWFYVGLVLLLLVTALFRKKEPSSAMGWSLAIVFMPVVGPLLFLLFGINQIPRRLRKKIAHHAQFEERLTSVCRLQDHEFDDPGEYSANRWGRLGSLLEGLGEAPRRGGNETRLFSSAIEFRDAAIPAIESARHHIHVQFYIFRNDRIGNGLIDRLIDKVKEGVQVRVLVDGVGSGFSWPMLSRLRRAGGQVGTFLPLLSPSRVSPNLRNHRKLIICDGEVGFFGGMNVGEEYLGRFGRIGRDWYDLHMLLRGPAVWDLQQVFAEDWDFSTGETLDDLAYFPRIDGSGSDSAQVITGGPDRDVDPIREAFFYAFTRAQRRITIATPYLVPDRALRDALTSAARAGVEVRLVTQSSPPDRWITYWCGQYYVEELTRAGVRVFEYTPGMMHAKAIAVDDEWAMLGTANLDNRSMFLNFEQMTVFDGAEAVLDISSELERLVGLSQEISLERIVGRSSIHRFLTRGARLFAPLL